MKFADALAIAAEAHEGQVYQLPTRKPVFESGNDDEMKVEIIPVPYVVHCARVAGRVFVPPGFTNAEEQTHFGRLVAALHDTLEDTSLTAAALRDLGVPRQIVNGVILVTKRDVETYAEYIERVRTTTEKKLPGARYGRLAKIADLEENIANTLDLPVRRPGPFASEKEKRAYTGLYQLKQRRLHKYTAAYAALKPSQGM